MEGISYLIALIVSVFSRFFQLNAFLTPVEVFGRGSNVSEPGGLCAVPVSYTVQSGGSRVRRPLLIWLPRIDSVPYDVWCASPSHVLGILALELKVANEAFLNGCTYRFPHSSCVSIRSSFFKSLIFVSKACVIRQCRVFI